MNGMITLHAATYTNIGPFAHKTLTVNFHRGKYLIKAPIGSGKSFLFFDGPQYGLYKYATRKMVNATCNKGLLCLLYTLDDIHYLIVRKLTAGKSKDRCQSQVYIVDGLPTLDTQVISSESDIRDILTEQGYSYEEQVFKNESDLQANLLSILPPREVFSSTVFLMQDAPNIFEMLPGERIEVFKNIFGMLGIDEAKSTLAEKRRTIQATRKVKADTQQYQQKLQEYIHTITKNYTLLRSSSLLGDVFLPRSETIEEWLHFEEKIQITGFSLMGIEESVLDNASALLEQKTKEYEKNSAIYEHKQLAITNEQKKLAEHQSRLDELTQLISVNQRKLSGFDEQKITSLKQQKAEITEQLTSLNKQVPYEICDEYTDKSAFFAETLPGADNHNSNSSAGSKNDNAKTRQLQDIKYAIDACLQQGKYLAEQKKTLETRLDTTLKQQKMMQEQHQQLALDPGSTTYESFQREINSQQTILQQKQQQLQTAITHMEEKQKDYQKRREGLEKKLKNFDDSIASASRFDCEKIKQPCPYIQMINSKSLHDLQQQKSALQEELTQVIQAFDEQQYHKDLESLRHEYHSNKQARNLLATSPKQALKSFVEDATKEYETFGQTIQKEEFDRLIPEYTKEIKAIEQEIQLIKEFMKAIQWQTIQKLYEQARNLEQTIQKLDQEITQSESLLEKITTIKQTLISQEKEKELLGKMLQTQTQLIAQMKQEIMGYKDMLNDPIFAQLKNDTSLVGHIQKAYQQLRDLLADVKQSQREVEQLLMQEKRLYNLYTIFSKELLFVVLQTALPTLNEIINSYLAQVVDYTLTMSITEQNDKLVMHALIEDEKGEREISSLSGGQKTVLKLVWMLSVASYMRSSMLFLDETINNLDRDTVGLVADMLHDFIQQHAISFYTVTHSQQIQQMGIWDGIVTLEGIGVSG